MAEPEESGVGVLSSFQSFTCTVKWMTSHSGVQLQGGAPPSSWNNRDRLLEEPEAINPSRSNHLIQPWLWFCR